MFQGKVYYSNEYSFRTSDRPATPVIRLAHDTTLCAGDSVVLCLSATSGNQWYLNDVAVPNSTAVTCTPLVSGIYTVKAALGNCTSPFSAPLNFTITGVNSPAFEQKLSVGPTSVTRQLTVDYDWEFYQLFFR